MSKFGEIVDTKIPVLINFYTDWEEPSQAMHQVIKNVAAALGDRARVIKIDVNKNNDLAEALQIKAIPTFMIYKNGKMVWRQSGELDTNTIIVILEKYTN